MKIIVGITCAVGIPDPHTNCINFWSCCPSTSGMRRKFGEPSIRLQSTLSSLPDRYGVETHSGSDIFWRLLKKSDFKMVAALRTAPARLATTRLTSSIAAGPSPISTRSRGLSASAPAALSSCWNVRKTGRVRTKCSSVSRSRHVAGGVTLK